VAGIKDVALRKVYAGKLDRWLGLMDEDLVLNRIGTHIPGGAGAGSGPGQQGRRPGAGGRGVPAPRAPEAAGYDPADPVTSMERQVLKLALQRPALLGPTFDGLTVDAFTAPSHRAVRELVAGCGGVAAAGPPREWGEVLLDAAPHDSARMFLTRLAVEPVEAPGEAAEPDARFADELLSRLEAMAVSRRIAVVKTRLQRMNPVTEESDYNHLFGDLVALEQRRKLLLERTDGA
jgi:DNA primase